MFEDEKFKSRNNLTRTGSLRFETTTPKPGDLVAIDASWVLICAFIVFTMQTGFGLLEAGMVQKKNVTNIVLKNVADVILGGFTYWIFGYGITYGTWPGSSPVFGIGIYAVDSPGIDHMGDLFTSFFFQLSFATTATTIVSGAMAERCNFKAYCLYSCFASITYSVQARWIWGPTGFLSELGVIDLAGSGAVHLMGGTAAFVSAWMLGPRLGRYDQPEPPPPGSPMSVLLGLMGLWWGWFAFNAGSTYGMIGDRWKFAARAATTTIIASIGGGIIGIIWSFVKGRRGKAPFEIMDLVNSILGALVGITAGCSIFHTPEAFLTGIIGGIVAIGTSHIPDKFKVDDPVSATAVHGFAGIWGMLSVGFFADEDGGVLKVTKGNAGLIRGGSPYLLGVQLLAVCCIIAWSFISTLIILWVINRLIPLRVTEEEELKGLDLCEHGISGDYTNPKSPILDSMIAEPERMSGRKTGGRGSASTSELRRSKRKESWSKSSTTQTRNRWTILLWRALKHLPRKERGRKLKDEPSLGWNPAQTIVQYTSPLSEMTDSTIASGERVDSPREPKTRIFEWTRNQVERTEQEVIIVKTM